MLGRKKNKNVRNPRIEQSSGRAVPTNNYYRSPARAPQRADVKITTEKGTGGSKILLSRIVNILIIGAIVVLLFFATTLSSSPAVLLPKNSYTYRPVSEYKSAASDTLKGDVLARSKFLFRSQTFETALFDRFPELEQVEAIVPLGGRDLTVSLQVSEPLALITNGSDEGVLNTNGVLVTMATSNHDGLLPIRFTMPQENFKSGARLFTSNETELIQLLQRELETLAIAGMPAVSLSGILFNVADGQMEVSLKDLPFYIKVSTYNNAQEQVGALKAALRQLDRGGTLPSKYIDARVPGRIFVL